MKITLYSKALKQSAYEPHNRLVYSRSDYDDYRWWTSWFHQKKETPSQELVKEIDAFQSALFEMPEFQSLDTLCQLCKTAETTGDPTEYNLYSETEHFHIWLRMITRKRDYNLYVNYYPK